MNEQVFRDYQLVLPETVSAGTLVVQGARIAAIETRASSSSASHKEYLLPGLIELHSDTLENCAAPRPGVEWPLDLAVVHQNRLLLSAGITTACNALAIRDVPQSAPTAERVARLVGAVTRAQAAGRLMADHCLHLRCELTCSSAPDVLEQYLTHSSLLLVSLMDHRPGQRQFQSRTSLDRYYFGKYGMSSPEVDIFLKTGLLMEEEVDENRHRIVAMAQSCACLLASHDDTTATHVQEALQDGVCISEFPTTPEAAQSARYHGLAVAMGAPNLALGGSHSGNLSSLEAARSGLLTLLSSDYAPHSLLPAVFRLAQTLEISLAAALKTVTQVPAALLSMAEDRGSLEIGKRADFITVRVDDSVPLITSVFVAGQRVA